MTKNDNTRQKASNGEVLTLSEAAAYLKLAERTIQRMIQRTEIPCARVGGQWRFLRSVLDDWLLSRMQVLPRNELAPFLDATDGIVRLSPLVDPELIVDRLPAADPREILSALIQPLRARRVVQDEGALLRALLARENMSSTALGRGVAVPHVRRPADNPQGAPPLVVGVSRDGTDYRAPDGEPVNFFFLITTTSEVVHLRLLKRITVMFREPGVRDALLACHTASDFATELARWEEEIFREDTQL